MKTADLATLRPLHNFHSDFLQLMNNKNTDNQSESTLLLTAWAFKAAEYDITAEFAYNKQNNTVGEDANIVIVLVVNGPLMCALKLQMILNFNM